MFRLRKRTYLVRSRPRVEVLLEGFHLGDVVSMSLCLLS